MIKTESVTVIDPLTKTQPSTTPNPFPDLELLDTPTVPTFTELLAEYNASISQPKEAKNRLTSDEAPDPFAIYQSGGLTNVRPQPVQWLWQNRLPLAGITLLDGDRGCGKSLLALQIAAHVSSGMSMLDGTPTIPGGVIVITPHINAATTQLQLLTALGADLSRIEILSYVPEPNDDDSTSRYRPFSLPEDMDHLLEAIKRLDARLIVLDPLMSLLSHHNRWTDQRLAHLLSTLNQRLIERNVACLITRNCHGKGGYARPSILERSERFSTIAVSRLLLAPDPMYPDRPLLSHVLSRHNIALTPTCSLQIQPLPGHPDLPYITFHGYHNLLARDFIDYRSDTLHRRLLSDHLLAVITKATDPIHVSTLYTLFPHCSAFQIQRSLSDLLRTDQIQRPARGFYAKTPTTTTPITEEANNLKESAATTPTTEEANNLKESAATTPTTEEANNLKESAATTPITEEANNLKESAATTLRSQRPHQGRNKHKGTKKRR